MSEFDFRILQHTDPRQQILPEIRQALVERRESGDSFQVQGILNHAFSNPSAFLNDARAQQAFLDLVGPARAREMMRAFRLFGITKERPLRLMADEDEVGDGWQTLNGVISLSGEGVTSLANGNLRIAGTSNRKGIEIDPRRLPDIIRRVREAAYRSREMGLPLNVLKSLVVDFITGEVKVVGREYEDQLHLNAPVVIDRALSNEKRLLDIDARFAPDIGLRLLGEQELAMVANELLRWFTRMGGEERIVDNWSYGRSINGLIDTFSDVDATAFIEELVDEGDIAEGRRHLVVATYHDYLLSRLESRLQWLAGIEPRRASEATVDAMMRSLFLALDSIAMPVELRDDDELASVFYSSRDVLRKLMTHESDQSVRAVMKVYLKRHGQRGAVWFFGQVLPLVALFGKEDFFRENGVDLAHAFDPDAHYGWGTYGALVDQVRDCFGPNDDDPNGGERMLGINLTTPTPASGISINPLNKPRTSNLAPSPIRGGMILVARAMRLAAG